MRNILSQLLDKYKEYDCAEERLETEVQEGAEDVDLLFELDSLWPLVMQMDFKDLVSAKLGVIVV